MGSATACWRAWRRWLAGRDAVAHAHKISNGGPPVVLIAEEEVVTF